MWDSGRIWLHEIVVKGGAVYPGRKWRRREGREKRLGNDAAKQRTKGCDGSCSDTAAGRGEMTDAKETASLRWTGWRCAGDERRRVSNSEAAEHRLESTLLATRVHQAALKIIR